MAINANGRSFFQRVFGISAAKLPADKGCWKYLAGKLVIDLSRAPELSREWGAARFEGGRLPDRVLVIHGADGRYYALINRCGHAGRRLDPVPGEPLVRCCSVGKTTYDFDGNVISGPGEGPIETCHVKDEEGKLVVNIQA